MDVHILINTIETVYPDTKIVPDEDYNGADCILYHPHLTKTDYELRCDIIAADRGMCIAFDFGDFGDCYCDYIDEALLLKFKTRVEEIFKLIPFHDNDNSAMDYKKYAVIDFNPEYKVQQ